MKLLGVEGNGWWWWPHHYLSRVTPTGDPCNGPPFHFIPLHRMCNVQNYLISLLVCTFHYISDENEKCHFIKLNLNYRCSQSEQLLICSVDTKYNTCTNQIQCKYKFARYKGGRLHAIAVVGIAWRDLMLPSDGADALLPAFPDLAR